jgi:hypothetical protein
MCYSGKRTYANGACAYREARKLRRLNHARETLKPYRCDMCGQFHLGNGDGSKNNLRQEKRNEARLGR